jgi:site-specific DNA-methyltransferase (adenine-specific)
MKKVKLMLGDNISSLKKLPDNSIDSIVSDPPYGLSFMGKKWDYDVPSVEFWSEVYRVLKPGGHVLSFGGTRTYHRMVVNIEDAGFEIRDQIMWLYGSGFPKSHNIGKAVDKLEGNDREEYIDEDFIKRNPNNTGINRLVTDEYGNNKDNRKKQAVKNENAGIKTKGQSPYEGWGTALKPANEPICVARKPLSEKSVAENVLKWGTGGINIDGCRVGFNGDKPKECELVDFRGDGSQMNLSASGKDRKVLDKNYIPNSEGRFPANIILECLCDEVIKGDEIKGNENYKWNNTSCEEGSNTFTSRGKYTPRTETPDIHTDPMCPCYLMDEQSGISTTKCVAGVVDKTAGVFQSEEGKSASGHKKKVYPININDKGGASRFFYQAKVSKAERNMGLDHFEEKEKIGNLSDVVSDSKLKVKNNHPTVKPVALMAYLCRLVTPPNGIVLDPFMGSGSTGIAAQLEGFRFCGMEMDEDYFKIASARIENFESYRKFIKK